MQLKCGAATVSNKKLKEKTRNKNNTIKQKRYMLGPLIRLILGTAQALLNKNIYSLFAAS